LLAANEAAKKHWTAALIAGLVLSGSALVISIFRILPVEIIGIVSGLITMLAVYIVYRKNNNKEIVTKSVFNKKVFKSCMPFYSFDNYFSYCKYPIYKNET